MYTILNTYIVVHVYHTQYIHSVQVYNTQYINCTCTAVHTKLNTYIADACARAWGRQSCTIHDCLTHALDQLLSVMLLLFCWLEFVHELQEHVHVCYTWTCVCRFRCMCVCICMYTHSYIYVYISIHKKITVPPYTYIHVIFWNVLQIYLSIPHGLRHRKL